MAEGFGRKYGSDVMECASAGFAPASIVQPLTKKVMEAKNINIDEQFPKHLDQVNPREFDLIVNISGNPLPPRLEVESLDWKIEDPIGKSEEVYVVVRDQIENLVMHLILRLRRAARKTQPGTLPRRRLRSLIRPQHTP
jgi:arsenate reductase